MFRLFSLAIIIGLIWLEVVVFDIVGDAIGVLPTIIGVFVTAVIGMRLFRIAGLATLRRMAATIGQGRAPIAEIADGAAIILAAILLMIPGYATDALGLVLFIPGLRVIIMIVLLTFIQQIAPNLGGRGFRFTNQHTNTGGGPGFNAEMPYDENPVQDDNDVSNVTIEGDYKRDD